MGKRGTGEGDVDGQHEPSLRNICSTGLFARNPISSSSGQSRFIVARALLVRAKCMHARMHAFNRSDATASIVRSVPSQSGRQLHAENNDGYEIGINTARTISANSRVVKLKGGSLNFQLAPPPSSLKFAPRKKRNLAISRPFLSFFFFSRYGSGHVGMVAMAPVLSRVFFRFALGNTLILYDGNPSRTESSIGAMYEYVNYSQIP